MVLPLASVARIVTATATPAVCGELMVLTTNLLTPAGITWMPGLVVPWIDPLVRSETVRVCVPTVPSETLNCFDPLTRTPVTGVLAAGSLEVIRTPSPLETGFQKSSVAHTVTLKE